MCSCSSCMVTVGRYRKISSSKVASWSKVAWPVASRQACCDTSQTMQLGHVVVTSHATKQHRSLVCMVHAGVSSCCPQLGVPATDQQQAHLQPARRSLRSCGCVSRMTDRPLGADMRAPETSSAVKRVRADRWRSPPEVSSGERGSASALSPASWASGRRSVLHVQMSDSEVCMSEHHNSQQGLASIAHALP